MLASKFRKAPQTGTWAYLCFGRSAPGAPEGHRTAKALLGARVGGRPQAQSPGQQQAGPSPGSSPLQILLIPSVQSKGMSVGLHYLSF